MRLYAAAVGLLAIAAALSPRDAARGDGARSVGDDDDDVPVRNPPQCYDVPGGELADCGPSHQFCDVPFENAPAYHLMDQQGCAENDPNGPVFDPVHGVFHHFYQIHLAAPPGSGPDYGHFVSKNLIEWAALPVAIWNGLDASTGATMAYDDVAIYTGSATLVPGAGPTGALGVVQIYPGLCDGSRQDNCQTGTLLAMATPADYEGDELLVNWTKSAANPIVNNTQRDPSTAWKTAAGEWRLRTYDSMVYGAASDEDFIAGTWYEIGKSPDLRTCECPSLYPLPASTPGFEDAYDAADLPTHVHKTSCGGDWWQVGNYLDGAPKTPGNFSAAPGWEDEFEQRKMDDGGFYASKDTDYPTTDGAHRRVNYGWAQVPPKSAQTLPREVTFNAAARQLQQYPIAEVDGLRGPAAVDGRSVSVDGDAPVDVPANVTRQAEVLVVFDLPSTPSALAVSVGDLSCEVAWSPVGGGDYADYNVTCGGVDTTLRLLAAETQLEVRMFLDWTFAEIFLQRGRTAVTASSDVSASPPVSLHADATTNAVVSVYPMNGIWVDEATVRATDRVYQGWA